MLNIILDTDQPLTTFTELYNVIRTKGNGIGIMCNGCTTTLNSQASCKPIIFARAYSNSTYSYIDFSYLLDTSYDNISFIETATVSIYDTVTEA